MLEQAGAPAAEALETLPAFRPDVLLSDIAMPDEDGFSLVRKVRAPEGPLADVPAVALTAYAHADDGRRARRAGFQLHLPEPIEPHRIALAIRGVFRPAS